MFHSLLPIPSPPSFLYLSQSSFQADLFRMRNSCLLHQPNPTSKRKSHRSKIQYNRCPCSFPPWPGTRKKEIVSAPSAKPEPALLTVLHLNHTPLPGQCYPSWLHLSPVEQKTPGQPGAGLKSKHTKTKTKIKKQNKKPPVRS